MMFMRSTGIRDPNEGAGASSVGGSSGGGSTNTSAAPSLGDDYNPGVSNPAYETPEGPSLIPMSHTDPSHQYEPIQHTEPHQRPGEHSQALKGNLKPRQTETETTQRSSSILRTKTRRSKRRVESKNVYLIIIILLALVIIALAIGLAAVVDELNE